MLAGLLPTTKAQFCRVPHNKARTVDFGGFRLVERGCDIDLAFRLTQPFGYVGCTGDCYYSNHSVDWLSDKALVRA
jgi:hypothetical protein